jgi:hypothetical protein
MVDAEIQELVKPDDMPPLQWEWWKEWWAQDYSWNSEQFKPYREVIANSYNASGILGSLESTLKSQGHLIESPEGTLFHICWLPPYWRDGTASEFYLHPISVRNKATNAFVTYFREYNGNYAGLTSTLALMLTSVSHGVPLSRVEKGFFGGPFVRIKIGASTAVELRFCLLAFGEEKEENCDAVNWNIFIYRTLFSTPSLSVSGLNFKYITFQSTFSLTDCDIEGNLSFQYCSFLKPMFMCDEHSRYFKRTINGSLVFSDCNFSMHVNANIKSKYQLLRFSRCKFDDVFYVDRIRVTRSTTSNLSFRDSIFEKKVVISAENLIEVAPAFADATLRKGVDFGPFEAALDRKFFKKLRGDVLSCLYPDFEPRALTKK